MDSREVLVSIQGWQFDMAGDQETVETMVRVIYYNQDDSHYVVYEAAQEGGTENTHNVLRFNENELDLTKEGGVNVHMLF